MAEPFADEEYEYYYTAFTQEELRPTKAEWKSHIFWFLMTFFTVTIAGLLPPFGSGVIFEGIPFPETIIEWLFVVPTFYGALMIAVVEQVAADPTILIGGLSFSGSLLAILTAHEYGHYIACRIYGVKATLPFFIPMPFGIFPTGTLGAVIRIQSPMPSRRAVFDIGVAGPLAGFAVIIPIAIIGLLTLEFSPPEIPQEFSFSNPLLIYLLGALLGIDITFGTMNHFYFAAWVGLLVTAMNLIPASQLDGGHVTYAVFGERVHYWVGRVAFVAMIALTILGWQLYNSPSGLLFTILLAVLLRIPHPQPLTDEPLDAKRKFIAFITLIVFVLSFAPFPIRVN